jgi:hypothetical protein
MHKVVLENDFGTFSDDVLIEPGATASLVVPMTKPQGGNVSGWIAISAPADLQVFEGGPAGGQQPQRPHHGRCRTARAGARERGAGLSHHAHRGSVARPGGGREADWPKGWIALNALPWAEVSIRR